LAGEPLPPIRPLAEQLRVNRNTIAKAYAELETQGIIESLPGKGCFLKDNGTPFKRAVRQELLAAELDSAIVQAHHFQIGRDDFLELVNRRLDAFEAKRARALAGAGTSAGTKP